MTDPYRDDLLGSVNTTILIMLRHGQIVDDHGARRGARRARGSAGGRVISCRRHGLVE
jgi:hypothetical protein